MCAMVVLINGDRKSQMKTIVWTVVFLVTAKVNHAVAGPGALDPTYLPVLNGGVNAIALQANGGAVIGGAFYTANGVTRNHLARLFADGSLDSAFLTNEGGVSG